MRFLSGLVLGGLLWIGGSFANAADVPDPLRLIPQQAEVVLKIEKPRAFVEAILKNEVFQYAQNIDSVRQALDSADMRRFYQLLSYYEKDLGGTWPELLDRLAGGGIAIGTRYGDKPPLLMAIQSTDAKALVKFVKRVTEVLTDEVQRQGTGTKPSTGKYLEFDTITLTPDLHIAQIQDFLIVGNQIKAVEKGIDQHMANISKGGKPSQHMANHPQIPEARKLLPANPLAWLWLNFEPLKNKQEAKDLFAQPRNDVVQTILLAGWLDVARRSSFITAGFYAHADGFQMALRAPAGRDGVGKDVVLHLPREANKPASLPLLEPKGVLFSHSFYLDLAAFWDHREEVFPKNILDQFVMGEKQVSRFTVGTSLRKMFQQGGTYHRFVAAHSDLPTGYKTKPQDTIPPFAFVMSMRDPALANSINVVVRLLGLGNTSQFKMKMTEGKFGEIPYISYRFEEGTTIADDPRNARFNFTPTVAAVQDQYIFSSSENLCKELVGILEKENRNKGQAPNMQMQFYAKGVGELIYSSPEQMLAQTILSEGISLEEAKKQSKVFQEYFNKLGAVRLQTDYQPKAFHFDTTWKWSK